LVRLPVPGSSIMPRFARTAAFSETINVEKLIIGSLEEDFSLAESPLSVVTSGMIILLINGS
jgi:hypothetical protein